MKTTNYVAILATTLLITSCSTEMASYTGSAVGSAVGALLGERVAGTTGQIIGSALGSALGAQTGSTIANRMEARATRAQASETASLSIANITFQDQNGDNAISANEACTLTFDVMNNTNSTLYMLTPIVQCSNLNMTFSKASTIQSIAPMKGVRYATQFAASSVKGKSSANFTVVLTDANGNSAQVGEFSITTK